MLALIISTLCVASLIVGSIFLIGPILSLLQILLFGVFGCVLCFLALSSWIILWPFLLLIFPLALSVFLSGRNANGLISTIGFGYSISVITFVISLLLLLIALLNRKIDKKIRFALVAVSFLMFCGAISMQNMTYRETSYIRFNQDKEDLLRKKKLAEKGIRDRYKRDRKDNFDSYRREKLDMKEALKRLDRESSDSDDVNRNQRIVFLNRVIKRDEPTLNEADDDAIENRDLNTNSEQSQ